MALRCSGALWQVAVGCWIHPAAAHLTPICLKDQGARSKQHDRRDHAQRHDERDYNQNLARAEHRTPVQNIRPIPTSHV
jgi:hypothetical protein